MEISMDLPTVIAVVITLPLDQILKLIVPHSTVKDFFDCVLFLPNQSVLVAVGGPVDDLE
jgi:hypothetical protein